MAEIVLFHHVQGLTRGVLSLGDTFRAGGHVVHTPDMFAGRTFATIEEGLDFVEEQETHPVDVGLAAAEQLSPELVYVGLSFGVMAAQQLAQTRPGARGALLLHSCLPIGEFGGWPSGVPVQIHGSKDDEFFVEDLPAARELAALPEADLYLYPGDQHLFTDSSLPAYDRESSTLLMERAMRLLASV